jgi:Toastrack DUF4097
MMTIRSIRRAVLMGLLTTCIAMTGASAEEWTFSSVDEIELDGVSGDVVVRPAGGGGGRVELKADVSPADSFEATVEENGSTLELREKWRGNSSGRVEWTIYLPDGDEPRITISTASGSLDCRGVTARIELSTASGDIDLEDVDLGMDSDLSTASGDYTIEEMTVRDGSAFSTASGDIELRNVELEAGVKFSTASGDVKCRGCTGHLELSSASGDVVVEDSVFEGPSRLSSASGDVALYLEQMPTENVTASSASGDVLLDSRDYGGSYTLILTRREDKGRIDCPFEITSSRTYMDRHPYEEQRVERGSGGPEIDLRTSSGKVIVRD